MDRAVAISVEQVQVHYFPRRVVMEAVVETPVADSTHEMAVMNHTGDTKITWNENDPVSVAAARAAFDAAKKQGHAGYSVDKKGERGAVIREFDPGAEKIIMAPATVGG
jgi:hypothetical protein